MNSLDNDILNWNRARLQSLFASFNIKLKS